MVEFYVANISAGAYSTTISLGAGMTVGATRVLPQYYTQRYQVIVTSATAATVLTAPAITYNV